MICDKCGAQVDGNVKFCSMCGNQISSSEVMNSQVVSNTSQSVATNQKGRRKPNIPGIVAGIAFCLSSMLPLVTVTFLGSTAEKSLMDIGDGFIVLIIGLLMILASVVGSNVLVTIFGLIGCGFALLEEIIQFHGEKAVFYNRGSGYYLMLFGAIAVLVSGIYGIVNNKQRDR
ncbi:MAG: zinc ribbon domain-containing protein [Clostridiales bacterium]|nr:zinc ribbon domain-containing protein [Clostridiales bacterium]